MSFSSRFVAGLTGSVPPQARNGAYRMDPMSVIVQIVVVVITNASRCGRSLHSLIVHSIVVPPRRAADVSPGITASPKVVITLRVMRRLLTSAQHA
jgi:hypothetical protein